MLTLAKLRVTFSVRRSSPPDPPVEIEVISTSSTLILRYSTGFSPALRTTRVASLKCLPSQQAKASFGVEESTHFVKLMSWTLHLPAPAPPPTCADPELLIPHDQANTSMSLA